MSVISAVQGIRDEIATRLNEIESDNFDIYNNWINLGLRDIVYTFPDAPFLRTSADYTLSSGTRIYNTGNIATFLSAAERINQIVNPQTQTKLMYYAPEQFDIIAPSATQGGSPVIFTIRGYLPNANIEFWPTPGSNYTIHCDFQKTIGTVSAGSATIGDLPTKYYEGLILYGEMLGLRRSKRYDLVKTVDQYYQTFKQNMMQDILRQTSQMPRIQNVREFTLGNNITTDPIQVQFFSNQF